MNAAAKRTLPLLVALLLFAATWAAPGSEQAVESAGRSAPLDKTHAKVTAVGRAEAGALTEQVSRELPATTQGKVERKNLIDDHIFGKMERDSIPHAGLSSDEEFLRRIYIDLWGRIPPPDKIRDFIKDETPEKRDTLIDEMLGFRYEIDPNDPYQGKAHGPWLVDAAFLHKWTYWFGDLFQSGRAQLGDGRNAFHDYIYLSLKLNIPYSEFVRRMLTATSLTGATSGPANLLLRDHVDDAMDVYINHEDTLDEIAISTAKYFLGLNLGCVSCTMGQTISTTSISISRRRSASICGTKQRSSATFVSPGRLWRTRSSPCWKARPCGPRGIGTWAVTATIPRLRASSASPVQGRGRAGVLSNR